jgi:hypothetical protein
MCPAAAQLIVWESIIWRLYPPSRSYYVRKLFASLGRILFALSIVGFFINIGLWVFGELFMTGTKGFELQTLALLNMILLSFVLLREPNQKSK